MGDHSNLSTTDNYATLLARVTSVLNDLGMMFDGTSSTNIPTNYIKWDSSAKVFKQWNSSAWVDLAVEYEFKVKAGNTSITPIAALGSIVNVQAALEAIAGTIPSGTKMLFQQSTAPTGWTKITTYNDYALRVVNGAVGSGGTLDFTAAMASSRSTAGTVATGSVGNTGLNGSQNGVHLHGVKVNSNNGGGGGSADVCRFDYYNTTMSSENSIGGGTHTHSLVINSHAHSYDMCVKYLDVIIASKN